MDVKKELSQVAALIGEPARIVMLWSLLDGEFRTAGELAFEANVSAQSASAHLAKLAEAGMLIGESRGRHRCYKIASAEVASAIEALATLLTADKTPVGFSHRVTPELKLSRTCYDHLAGQASITIARAMQKNNLIIPRDRNFDLTAAGEQWLTNFGIDPRELKNKRRCFARQCLDWSEREPHIAGALGAALLDRLLDLGWILKTQTPRVVRITLSGRRGLWQKLRINV